MLNSDVPFVNPNVFLKEKKEGWLGLTWSQMNAERL